MLSIDYDLKVPGFSEREIGYSTLVRDYLTNFEVQITNDSKSSISVLNVKITLESYVGQIEPIMFKRYDPKIIENIQPRSMVPLNFEIFPTFPGLLAISIRVTDSFNNTVQLKKAEEESYQKAPVRYWFYVADDISVETLRALKQLLRQGKKGKKK